MYSVISLAILLGASLVQVTSASPQLSLVKPAPTLIVDPAPLPVVTVYSTVSECPLGKCTRICATPTVTVKPTGKCIALPCPVARCMYVPAITSTSTSYCRGACGTTLTTTNCEKMPTVTAVPPCPTTCPELCPIPIETVAVACPTSVTRIVVPPETFPTLVVPGPLETI